MSKSTKVKKLRDVAWTKDIGGMTNGERADGAKNIVEQFAGSVGLQDDDRETQLGDLLTDIMHLCRREGVDFEASLRLAHIHHDTERKGVI